VVGMGWPMLLLKRNFFRKLKFGTPACMHLNLLLFSAVGLYYAQVELAEGC
jgi:hypothetical protein